MLSLKTPYVVLKVAEGEVGYLEKQSKSSLYDKTANSGQNNYTKYANDFDTKYTDFYNGKKQAVAWCDMFVDWCFVTAFGEKNAMEMLYQPTKSAGAGCKFSAGYYRAHNAFFSTPKVGDQIFFGKRGEESHTGLVYKVDASRVYTIEGNTSSASGVVANGGSVSKKSYALNYSRISGYGRPKYDSEPVEQKPAVMEKQTEQKKTIAVPKAGQVLNLNKAELFSGAYASVPVRAISGTYYLYDAKLINGKYRITNKQPNVGKKPAFLFVTGYVDKGEI